MPVALRDRPVFICGHPKSGTSLLRAIFDAHPQLIVYPEETIFFRRYLPLAADLDMEAQLELADRLLIHIFQWSQENPMPEQDDFPGRDYSAVPFEEVRQSMRQLVKEQHRNDGDLLSAAVLAYGTVSGQFTPKSKYWVEKSPYNEYYSEQIFGWWPEAHCIHIVRDPRDNFASYRLKHPDWSAEFFAANWRRSTQAGLHNLESFGKERCLLLRYEDLAKSPEETLNMLVEFLNIDQDASMEAPTRLGQEWEGNSMFAQAFQGISAAPVARWKDNLSPEESAVIEIMARPLMDRLHYISSATDGATHPGLAARWRAATWPVRRKLRVFKAH
jgi:hypothetical protein